MNGDPGIRLLTAADLDGAFALSTTAGWNQRAADWRALLDLAPAGSFAALDDQRLIATAIGIDYGRFGWIAMMLVDPAYRGRGLGARLLEAAMGAIPPGRPVRLDATPLGRPLYERYGFTDETVLSRRVAESADRDRADAPHDTVAGIRPVSAADLPSVTARDQAVFGADRHGLLEWALAGAPHYAWLAPGASGQPQYCFGRSGRLFDHIGPVVADSDAAAKALVGAALRHAAGRPAMIDAFDAHTAFAAWLGGAGFRLQRPLYRMCRAGAGEPWKPADAASCTAEFAILGPEFG